MKKYFILAVLIVLTNLYTNIDLLTSIIVPIYNKCTLLGLDMKYSPFRQLFSIVYFFNIALIIVFLWKKFDNKGQKIISLVILTKNGLITLAYLLVG
jgi:hypothetical protein